MSRRRRPLRIGDPAPPDAVEFVEAYHALASDQRRAVIDCIKSMPPGISGDEKVRRVCLAFIYPLGAVNAIVAQERRAAFRVV